MGAAVMRGRGAFCMDDVHQCYTFLHHATLRARPAGGTAATDLKFRDWWAFFKAKRLVKIPGITKVRHLRFGYVKDNKYAVLYRSMPDEEWTRLDLRDPRDVADNADVLAGSASTLDKVPVIPVAVEYTPARMKQLAIISKHVPVSDGRRSRFEADFKGKEGKGALDEDPEAAVDTDGGMFQFMVAKELECVGAWNSYDEHVRASCSVVDVMVDLYRHKLGLCGSASGGAESELPTGARQAAVLAIKQAALGKDASAAGAVEETDAAAGAGAGAGASSGTTAAHAAVARAAARGRVRRQAAALAVFEAEREDGSIVLLHGPKHEVDGEAWSAVCCGCNKEFAAAGDHGEAPPTVRCAFCARAFHATAACVPRRSSVVPGAGAAQRRVFACKVCMFANKAQQRG